jgi:hypothetical protein
MKNDYDEYANNITRFDIKHEVVHYHDESGEEMFHK